VTGQSWQEPVVKAGKATTVFLSHLILGSIILGGIRAFHWWYKLVGAQDGLLWNKVPMEWLFDTLDFGILCLFIFWGLISDDLSDG